MELAVADVERDHARGAALEQAVGEAAGRRADVEAVPARRVDAERVERVRELLAAARDEPRRALDLELAPLVDLLPGLVVARARGPRGRAPAPARGSRRARAPRAGRRGASSAHGYIRADGEPVATISASTDVSASISSSAPCAALGGLVGELACAVRARARARSRRRRACRPRSGRAGRAPPRTRATGLLRLGHLRGPERAAPTAASNRPPGLQPVERLEVGVRPS